MVGMEDEGSYNYGKMVKAHGARSSEMVVTSTVVLESGALVSNA